MFTSKFYQRVNLKYPLFKGDNFFPNLQKVSKRTLAHVMKSKKFVFVQNFKEMPKESDLKIVEEELPSLKDGEFLAQALYLSIDPYQRAYSYRLKPGDTMIGSQVARVIESKNKTYPVGKLVVGNFGWKTHTVARAIMEKKEVLDQQPPYVLPDIGDLPPSLGVGALGMPGNTAYFGLLEICKPKSGETVVVTGAAGAVGNHVGQIAKIKGCKVIGIAGTDEKCMWLKDLGFDHVINYKTTTNMQTALAEAAPLGIDCYFDNVGGEISSIILQQMNLFGRIAVCGSISSYNSNVRNLPKATIVQPSMAFKQLEMQGFIVSRWNNRWFEGIEQNLRWIKEGKLKYRETVTEGFENATKALIGVLNGENIGKAVVKV